MASKGGGGGDVHPHPKGFSSQWGELLFQTNFIFVGTALGHLSMKKNCQIGPTVFALKLDNGKVLGPPSIGIE